MSASNTRPGFTPGPWEVSDAPENGTYDVLSEPGARGDGWHEIAVGCSRHNARLIAAAPEMYEALRASLGRFEMQAATERHLAKLGVDAAHHLGFAQELEAHATYIRAALAKAEGAN